VRGFVAINLPAEVRARLFAAASPMREAVPGVRWTAIEALHLTLKFLGHFPDQRVPELAAAVETVAAGYAVFPLRLARAGAFPNARRPRVWWIGVESSDGLLALQREIDVATAALGFASEQRPYAPHLTIGRARGEPRRVPEATTLIDGFAGRAEFDVASVELMESRLSRAGARYAAVATAPLKPGSA